MKLLEQLITIAEQKPNLFRDNFDSRVAWRCAVADSNEQLRRFRTLQCEAEAIPLDDCFILEAFEGMNVTPYDSDEPDAWMIEAPAKNTLLLGQSYTGDAVRRRYLVADLLAKALTIREEQCGTA